MKKLILLLLVLIGMVCTASAAVYKVYVKSDAPENCHIYVWGDGVSSGDKKDWPGNQLSSLPTVVINSVTYRVKRVETSSNYSFKFSNNGSYESEEFTNKTKDFYLEYNKDSSSHSDLESSITTYFSTKIGLAGSFNDWKYIENVFGNDNKTTLTLSANTTYEFKLYDGSGNWHGNNGKMTWNDCSNWTFDVNNNCKIQTVVEGTYTFTVNTSGSHPVLTVTYPTMDMETVYFNNNLGWNTPPIVYLLGSSYWDNTYGSGSYGRLSGLVMEQIGSSNLWKLEYPSYYSSQYIAILKDRQDNKSNFENTEAVYRGDFSTTNPVYVPLTASNETKNGTKYYSNGAWNSYSAPNTPYERTGLTIGNFGTLCLPYNATVTGATVFEITSKVMDGVNLAGINLASTTDNKVEAGKSYIFKATATSLSATLSGNYAAATDANGMLGNLSSGSIYVPTDQGNYVIKDNKIWYAKYGGETGVKIGPNKAYIKLNDIGVATARGTDFISFDDGGTTAIETVKTKQKVNDEYFNLAGQRVAQPTKGLYIVNGKKVVIK